MNLPTSKVGRNGSRFLNATGIILTVTGLAKVFTVTGESTLLEVPDPIFGMEFRYLMLLGFLLIGSYGIMAILVWQNPMEQG